MNLIETALEIALEAHAGQTDKAGESYVLHPIRLMSKMDSEYEKATALLHDVIEDSIFTPDSLKEKGIPSLIIQAVICLTRNEQESYEAFIQRVTTNELAMTVKKADLEDNMNILRLKEIEQADLDRLKKYHKAWKKIVCA